LLGTPSVANNAASLTASFSLGTHSLVAAYAGDSNVSGSSGALSQIVTPAASNTVLVASVNPAFVEQPVTFTILVTPRFSGTPTGKVSLYKGKVFVANLALNNGQAAYTMDFDAGSFNLTAAYAGDSNFLPSSSAPLKEVVKKVPTAVSLVSSANPAPPGQAVTFTATVSSVEGAPPDGELVTLKDGSVTIGSGPLLAGQATFTTSSLPTGRHLIKAYYSGDSNFVAGKSSTLTEKIQ
jgi:hypothetical protein